MQRDNLGIVTADESSSKYEILIEAEGADGLKADPGNQVAFVWKRKGKISLSESAEVWDDGVVYWDAKCTQISTLTRYDDGSLKPKPCQILVQSFTMDDEGMPCGVGSTVGAASLDLSQYCLFDDDNENPDSHHVVLPLEPAGSISMYISSRHLPNWTPPTDYEASITSIEDEEDDSSSIATSIFSPSIPSSLRADESAVSLGFQGIHLEEHHHHSTRDIHNTEIDALNTVFPSSSSSPVHVLGNPDAFATPSNSSVTQDLARSDISADSTGTATATSSGGTSSENPSSITTTSSSSAAAIAHTSVLESVSALQKRCKRLSKERDEARAEAFAEASVAVQRGIEIDNLRRAKEMLLHRLESTEQQLMAMMRLDNEDSPSSSSLSVAGGLPAATQQQQQQQQAPGYGSSREIVEALVEAKVAIAEKEFEMMELSGQLRAREAHIEVLTEHLSAIKMRAERDALASPPGSSAGTHGMRSPVSLIAGTGAKVTKIAAAGKVKAIKIIAHKDVGASSVQSPRSSLGKEEGPVVDSGSGGKHTRSSSPMVHIIANASSQRRHFK